jgi:hypothetical protein
MAFFKQSEGDACIVVSNGVYQQTDVYERDGYLFAKVGGGFIRLMADGSTTKAKTRLEFISFQKDLYRDPLGRLCSGDAPGKKVALDGPGKQKLLGAES